MDRFLPGVPGADVERLLCAAPGDEVGSGKFDHPESSAALAVNAFGFFLHRAADLPPLPGCEGEQWPARSLTLEAAVRFPWPGGRHPVLDCIIATPSALIGIESKRFEPFRDRKSATFSDAYWRLVWGARMKGYERVRDRLRENRRLYTFLDAAQLVKHAFALRSQVHRAGADRGLKPILFYVYAEPEMWPATGRAVETGAINGHEHEIDSFARCVADDEVGFVSCPWRVVLQVWRRAPERDVRAHADAVVERFSP